MALDNTSKSMIAEIIEEVVKNISDYLASFGEFASDKDKKYAFIFGITVGAVLHAINTHYQTAHKRSLNKKERQELVNILLLRGPEIKKLILKKKE
ncbi:MAG: hypothetical protein ACE5KA_05980 [Nitrososphaerales archaeon]